MHSILGKCQTTTCNILKFCSLLHKPSKTTYLSSKKINNLNPFYLPCLPKVSLTDLVCHHKREATHDFMLQSLLTPSPSTPRKFLCHSLPPHKMSQSLAKIRYRDQQKLEQLSDAIHYLLIKKNKYCKAYRK